VAPADQARSDQRRSSSTCCPVELIIASSCRAARRRDAQTGSAWCSGIHRGVHERGASAGALPDDLQWIDAASLTLMEHLAYATRTPLLLLIGAIAT